MTITKNVDHNTLRITLEGRLDTNTAPQLEAELKSSTGGISELIFDFSGLDYISSAGLQGSACRTEDHEQAGEDDHSSRQRNDYGGL